MSQENLTAKKEGGNHHLPQEVFSQKEFDLNLHVARLLMDEPFFASVSRRVDKRPHVGIPTAGVCINPVTAQFELLYNPSFFAKLTDDERRDVLKHEFYHIVFLNNVRVGHTRKGLFDGICCMQSVPRIMAFKHIATTTQHASQHLCVF